MINIAANIHGSFIVIGDVHGQIDQLEVLLQNLKDETQDYEQRWIVFLGDLVDRGNNPKKVIDTVLDFIKNRGKTTSLMGNHEFVLLSALGLFGKDMERRWAEPYVREFSPDTTFLSYGVEPGNLEALKKVMPPEHKEFLLSLPWHVETVDYLIVHAGLLPDQPYFYQLGQLRKRDYDHHGKAPWLHEARLVSPLLPSDCPVTVISGHVRQPQVVITDKRILVDTSGGRGGKLSAILLPERKVISSW